MKFERSLIYLILLGFVFICLKSIHVIAWSWWLVLFPIYASVIGLLVAVGGIVIAAMIDSSRNPW